MKERIKIQKLFFINDRQQINVLLESFEWDFTSFGEVNLCIGEEKIKMRYIGYSNVNGKPVVVLTSSDSRINSVDDIEINNSSSLFLERIIV